jgi:hypothetical protein
MGQRLESEKGFRSHQSDPGVSIDLLDELQELVHVWFDYTRVGVVCAPESTRLVILFDF